MRPSRCIPVALAALVVALAAPETAHARRNKQAFSTAPMATAAQPIVTLTLEQPGGITLPSFLHFGSLYFAGQQGERYDLRLTNNTGERVEAMITVDGRDVISGELGNYKKQRGYVLDPWSSVVITGFRQSHQQVAAFRFADVGNAVAVFTEKRRSAKRHKKALAAAPPPPNYYEPYYQGPATPSAPPTAFPESERHHKSAGEPAAEESVTMAPSATTADGGGAGFAPPPAHSQLGTSYGQYSAVQEVEFKRKRKRKPDAVLTVYYDSLQGLQGKGINVSAPPLGGQPIAVEPQPFPQSGFAAPPPR